MGPVLGQKIAQVASADPPHHLGGCPAQAWSVAELLRTLHELLGMSGTFALEQALPARLGARHRIRVEGAG